MSEGDGRGANGLSERIMADLKDLQRDTVNYVFRRLYEDKDTARRFLIASETGLGKTLIARGVIARVIPIRVIDVITHRQPPPTRRNQ
jgi:superfamily II DNA or RNA helicase